MNTVISWTIQILLIPVISPFFVGLIRKIKAKTQNRQGASVFQPYRDLRKLFHKDEVISRNASWIFNFAPYFIFSLTLTIGASIPLFVIFPFTHPLSDFLVIIYLFALGTFFLALSGMDAGSAFGGFGSSREMTVAALAEGGLIFSLLTLVIAGHSTNLFSLAAAFTLAPPTALLLPIALAGGGFVIALLAENGRFPFDNPATHLELTMIHEAMILEYSGKKLALIEWAAANKLVIFASLGANLFFPWGLATTFSWSGLIIGLGIWLVKVGILCSGIALLESVIAKFRFLRLPDLLFISYILSVIALGLII